MLNRVLTRFVAESWEKPVAFFFLLGLICNASFHYLILFLLTFPLMVASGMLAGYVSSIRVLTALSLEYFNVDNFPGCKFKLTIPTMLEHEYVKKELMGHKVRVFFPEKNIKNATYPVGYSVYMVFGGTPSAIIAPRDPNDKEATPLSKLMFLHEIGHCTAWARYQAHRNHLATYELITFAVIIFYLLVSYGLVLEVLGSVIAIGSYLLLRMFYILDRDRTKLYIESSADTFALISASKILKKDEFQKSINPYIKLLELQDRMRGRSKILRIEHVRRISEYLLKYPNAEENIPSHMLAYSFYYYVIANSILAIGSFFMPTQSWGFVLKFLILLAAYLTFVGIVSYRFNRIVKKLTEGCKPPRFNS